MSYLVLAGSGFAAQALLFVPLVPLLVVSGALAAHGQLQLGWAAIALAAGISSGDFFWYAIGRRGGARVLKRVCRVAAQPDTCVRRTQNLFGRYGARALLIAKFIPGLSTVALPLAGVFGMRARRFVLYDLTGVLCWTCAYLIAGYVSARQVAAVPALGRAPFAAGALALAGLGGYAAWLYIRRQRARSAARIDRVPVEELRRKCGETNDVVIVDLRHRIDFERDPYSIPNALYIPAEELPRRYHEIPRNCDVVLYCTCPDEISSAQWAVRLRAFGIHGARPLEGGLAAWRSAGLPVTFVGPALPSSEWVCNAR